MKFKKLIIATLAFTSLSTLADKEHDALSTLALQRANFSLEDAIKKVSTTYNAQILEFEIDEHDNQTTYEIEAYNLETQEKHKVELSLDDGSVLKMEKKSPKILGLSRLDNDEQLALKDLKASNFDLSTTVAELKEKYNANIFEFELENEKGITFYKFKLMGEQGITRVIIDVQTGNIIPVMSH